MNDDYYKLISENNFDFMFKKTSVINTVLT